MIIYNGKPTIKELAFKENKKPKEEHDDSCCESNEEEANFLRKLKRGSRKYKGKLPFKFFKCGRVGHYASKCPKNKNKENDPREKFRKIQKDKNNAKKKILYNGKMLALLEVK